MTVTGLISFALLACVFWQLVDAIRTLHHARALHADATRRLEAAGEYAEQVHNNAAYLARILHPSGQPTITTDSDGRLTVDWPDPDITETVISRDALAGLIRDLNATRGHRP